MNSEMILTGKDIKSCYEHREIFSTGALRDDLKGRSLRGGLYKMTGEGINFILRLASTAILARILIPEHFGLISMVMALTAIAAVIKDFGLSIATVQAKEITHGEASALFWINVSVGALITLTLCMLSKMIARFYADDRLIWVTVGISATFLFGGITVQHQALLWRKMLFGRIATVDVGATIFSCSIAIFLGLKGYGYWALVSREIMSSFFLAIGTWMACGWIPKLPSRNVNIRKMIRVGGDVTAFNVVEFFSRSLDQILLGKFYGPSLLGIYKQGYQLASLPVNYLVHPVHAIAQPGLSVLQDDPVKYRQYYRKIVTSVSFVSMPLVVFLFIHSKDIVLLLLGEKWIEAARIFEIITASSFLIPVVSTTGFVMITCGLTRRFFCLGLAKSIILVLSFVVGIRWGAVGIAYGQLITMYVFVFPLLFLAFKNTPVRAELFFSSILHSLICSLLMGGALFAFSKVISVQNNFFAIAASLPIAIAFYLVAWMVIPGGTQRLKEFFSDFVFVFKKSQRGRVISLS